MNSDDFEAKMRAGEWFHSMAIPQDMWTVVRIDGRSFTRFTNQAGYEKPFDLRFRELMEGCARAVLEQMGGIYAYTESDEISVLFCPNWVFFSREVEKVVSISAGIATAAFNQGLVDGATGLPHFDARIWMGANETVVIDYFRWRQSDAARCALNGWCYWTLRNEGQSDRQATALLEGQGIDFKNELLFQRGINFNELPAWQRRGIGIYFEEYEKDGFNPKTQASVKGVRRRLKVDHDLPMKDAYADLLKTLLRDPELLRSKPQATGSLDQNQG